MKIITSGTLLKGTTADIQRDKPDEESSRRTVEEVYASNLVTSCRLTC